MIKRYGLLRTVISKDKKIKDKIYIPIYSNDLNKLEESYNYFINKNKTIVPQFNEVAIFDYKTCSYIKNNFKDREYFVNNFRR